MQPGLQTTGKLNSWADIHFYHRVQMHTIRPSVESGESPGEMQWGGPVCTGNVGETETGFGCIRLQAGEGAGSWRCGIQVRAGGRRRGHRLPTPGPREAARLHPSLGPPGPTVELEMADALALGVAGRGAAEAASQSLSLAALRPPAAAREGYR